MSDSGSGKKVWAFAAAHIPLQSTGAEPEFTSNDKLAVLNTTSSEAEIKILVYFEDQQPVGEYSLTIGAQRVRKFRLNDLIDPLPIPLDKPFALVVRSDVNVIVQFSRMDTSARALASFCVTPYFKS